MVQFDKKEDDNYDLSKAVKILSAEKKWINCKLKQPSTKKILSPKPHILKSNVVWNSWFWSEGPKNHLNLNSLVSKFVPWELGPRGRRTSDLEGWRHGTSRSFGAAPRGPCGNPRGPKAPLFEV